MNKAYIGVDPGAKGYICLLAPDSPKTIEYCSLEDAKFPPSYIYNWLKQMKAHFDIVVIMIEDVHSMHRMSAKSNFGFGYNVGSINTLCRVTGIGVDRVTPKVWQKTIGIKPKSTSIKKDVGAVCRTLYPSAEIFGARGGLIDGKSDSLMIAHYAFKQFTK